jgi:hypothetical protein
MTTWGQSNLSLLVHADLAAMILNLSAVRLFLVLILGLNAETTWGILDALLDHVDELLSLYQFDILTEREPFSMFKEGIICPLPVLDPIATVETPHLITTSQIVKTCLGKLGRAL